MRTNRELVLILTVVMVASYFSFGWAEMWEPYQFQPQDQEYEYRITNFEEGTQQVSHYILKIDRQDTGQLTISVQTTWTATEDELGSEILGGWWTAGAFGLTMAFINPMYAAFFGGLDLHVGNTMSFFGAGLVEVVGTEKVAGRTGYVCELLETDGGRVQGRYVVDPAVPLPLKTELFDEEGNRQFQTELLRISM